MSIHSSNGQLSSGGRSSHPRARNKLHARESPLLALSDRREHTTPFFFWTITRDWSLRHVQWMFLRERENLTFRGWRFSEDARKLLFSIWWSTSGPPRYQWWLHFCRKRVKEKRKKEGNQIKTQALLSQKRAKKRGILTLGFRFSTVPTSGLLRMW